MESCKFECFDCWMTGNTIKYYFRLNQYRVETICCSKSINNILFYSDAYLYNFKLLKRGVCIGTCVCSLVGTLYLWKGVLFTLLNINEKSIVSEFPSDIMIWYYSKKHKGTDCRPICELIYLKARLIKLVK